MGLIKAISGAVGGVIADQWKEFFYCESLSSDVLMTKGQKQVGSRSSNTKGNDNIISNGSGISISNGQCAIIVDRGLVTELCAEPGTFTYDNSTEPSIFTGSLGDSIVSLFKTSVERFKHGGDTGTDQRVYYFNIKEIIGNRYGTPNPIPFRVVDTKIGLDMDISIRCNGEYSYKIMNPMVFYTNIAGNVTEEYRKETLDSMLKTELLTALQPAFAKISAMGVRYSALMGHTEDMCNALNEILDVKWGELRGIELVSFGMNSVTAPKEDEDLIKELQKTGMLRDPNMAAATLASAQADAMRSAASNTATGPMMAFAGMNMAQGAGGMNSANLFQVGQQQAQQQQAQQQQQQVQAPQADGWACACGTTNQGKFCANCGQKEPAPVVVGGWECGCGITNTGKFCLDCGKPKPATVDGWACGCGVTNRGKFCAECGTQKPAGAPLYVCDKCGFKPVDPKNPPKFCPECGDSFDEGDIK